MGAQQKRRQVADLLYELCPHRSESCTFRGLTGTCETCMAPWEGIAAEVLKITKPERARTPKKRKKRHESKL